MAGKGLVATIWLLTTMLLGSFASAQEAKVFGDWELNCLEEAPCKLSQANVESGTENVRMRSEISLTPDNRVLLSLTLPNAILLTEGPWLTVDGVYVGELEYITCASGCIARAIYSRPVFNLVASGTRGIVTVISNTGQCIGVKISLAGLLNGLAALETAD